MLPRTSVPLSLQNAPFPDWTQSPVTHRAPSPGPAPRVCGSVSSSPLGPSGSGCLGTCPLGLQARLSLNCPFAKRTPAGGQLQMGAWRPREGRPQSPSSLHDQTGHPSPWTCQSWPAQARRTPLSLPARGPASQPALDTGGAADQLLHVCGHRFSSTETASQPLGRLRGHGEDTAGTSPRGKTGRSKKHGTSSLSLEIKATHIKSGAPFSFFRLAWTEEKARRGRPGCQEEPAAAHRAARGDSGSTWAKPRGIWSCSARGGEGRSNVHSWFGSGS